MSVAAFKKHCNAPHDWLCPNNWCSMKFTTKNLVNIHLPICVQMYLFKMYMNCRVKCLRFPDNYRLNVPVFYFRSNVKQIDNKDDIVTCQKCNSYSYCNSVSLFQGFVNHIREPHNIWCCFCNLYFVNVLDLVMHKCIIQKQGK